MSAIQLNDSVNSSMKRALDDKNARCDLNESLMRAHLSLGDY